MFHFTLDPIDEVAPWGEPPDLNLHWFGLTLGTYFIQAGEEQLLRYSDECLACFAAKCSAWAKPSFVDYQVARLYEDLFEIVPYILEPIPQELSELARSKRRWTWMKGCDQWLESKPETDPTAWETYFEAVNWISQRSLDTGYLSPSARIWFWRLGDTITVEWDNQEKLFDGVPAWAAQQGSYSLSVDQFVAELEAFRRSFLDAMRMRVDQVRRFWSRPDVRIDVQQVMADQEHHESPASMERLDSPPTNWSAVTSALTIVENSGTKFGPS